MRRLELSLLLLLSSIFIAAKSGDEPRILDGYSAASSQTRMGRRGSF